MSQNTNAKRQKITVNRNSRGNLADQNGNTLVCSNKGCKRAAKHVHHIQYHSEGGSDTVENLAFLCQECHVALHSAKGDFKVWGGIGGNETARSGKSFPNLKQFRGEDGAARFAAYLQQKADREMGLQS